jgi:hypothetical protein
MPQEKTRLDKLKGFSHANIIGETKFLVTILFIFIFAKIFDSLILELHNISPFKRKYSQPLLNLL